MEDPETDRESDTTRSWLVDEICSISKGSVFCHHIRASNCNRKVRFINWYDVLGVEETDGVHVIKKRYHKLALQLHPDKNKHPKAEFAFKLVAEAYVCLSDSTKRRGFDLEKLSNFCWECNNNTRVAYPKAPAAPPKKPSATLDRSSKSRRTISRSLKDIRERFREEVKVIENCLKANSFLTTKKELPPFIIPSNSSSNLNYSRRESPVFDPAHYTFNSYPHLRAPVDIKVPDGQFWYLGGRGSIRKSSSPLFGCENNGRGIARSSSSCVRS